MFTFFDIRHEVNSAEVWEDWHIYCAGVALYQITNLDFSGH
jgi:hypothetical protein|tara:strand:- start:679 stop:801 length:123 start_codon:yes stop_codon:yes gene_type:complete